MTTPYISYDVSFGDIQIVDRAANRLLIIMSQLHGNAFQKLGQQGWSADHIRSSLDQAGCHLAYIMKGRNVAGFALYKTVLDEAELFTLAVDPVYQRAGIASKLLTAIANQLKKAGGASFLLEVRSDNIAAIACYKKLGFEIVAVREEYYTDDSGAKFDASIMRLSL